MKNTFYGAILLFAVFMIISAIRFLFYQHKLLNHLLKNHTEKWTELTTVLGFGPGYANSHKGLKFLFSKNYLGDPEVLHLKIIVRNSFIYTIMGMIIVFLTFCVMVASCPAQ
jgi:hypothetical protein